MAEVVQNQRHQRGWLELSCDGFPQNILTGPSTLGETLNLDSLGTLMRTSGGAQREINF